MPFYKLAMLNDICVIPPRECNNRSFYWLRLNSAYGLVNANSKWQEDCDHLFVELGLTQPRYFPQFFFSRKECVNILEVKIVDDILITGITTVCRKCSNSVYYIMIAREM